MNDNYDPYKRGFTKSKARNLVKTRAALKKNQLRLVHKCETYNEKIKRQMEMVSNEGMRRLLKEGVPYNESIKKVLMDIEYHHQRAPGRTFSSIEEVNLLFLADAVMHSINLGLNFQIAQRIFHYWATTFHKEEYEKVMKEFVDQEGISGDLKKVAYELKLLL